MMLYVGIAIGLGVGMFALICADIVLKHTERKSGKTLTSTVLPAAGLHEDYMKQLVDTCCEHVEFNKAVASRPNGMTDVRFAANFFAYGANFAALKFDHDLSDVLSKLRW
jgi:hypothetical protein